MVVELAEAASLLAPFFHKASGLRMGAVSISLVLVAEVVWILVLACWFGSGVVHIYKNRDTLMKIL